MGRLVSAVFACLLLGSVARAQVLISFTETGNLPRNDDGYSAPIDLGFSINFGGTSYTQTFVSNNGYLTFGSGQGDYTPDVFNADYLGLPIIAAFFSDVDTRNELSGIVSWGTTTVGGNAAFVALWPNVGEYSFGPGGNTFQIVIVSRPDLGVGNFDLQINYGSITWDHSAAVAGFHTGGSSTTKTFFQLPGSMQEGAFLDTGANSLLTSSNTGAPGGILFQSRDGGFLEVAPVLAIPEPSTWALMMIGGVSAIWFARRRC